MSFYRSLALLGGAASVAAGFLERMLVGDEEDQTLGISKVSQGLPAALVDVNSYLPHGLIVGGAVLMSEAISPRAGRIAAYTAISGNALHEVLQNYGYGIVGNGMEIRDVLVGTLAAAGTHGASTLVRNAHGWNEQRKTIKEYSHASEAFSSGGK